MDFFFARVCKDVKLGKEDSLDEESDVQDCASGEQ